MPTPPQYRLRSRTPVPTSTIDEVDATYKNMEQSSNISDDGTTQLSSHNKRPFKGWIYKTLITTIVHNHNLYYNHKYTRHPIQFLYPLKRNSRNKP
jgi:hypothetical protein